MSRISIDMNNPQFQSDLFSLDKEEQLAIMRTLKKVSQLTWNELYKDSGLKWEAIISKKLPKGQKVYSFRFSRKYRTLALREESYLRLLALFTDHDSVYKT